MLHASTPSLCRVIKLGEVVANPYCAIHGYLYASPGVLGQRTSLIWQHALSATCSWGVLSHTAGCRGITKRGQEVPQSVWVRDSNEKGEGRTGLCFNIQDHHDLPWVLVMLVYCKSLHPTPLMHIATLPFSLLPPPPASGCWHRLRPSGGTSIPVSNSPSASCLQGWLCEQHQEFITILS